MMMKSKIGKLENVVLKVGSWIPAIVMAIAIFMFSGQVGSESSGGSERIAHVLVSVVNEVSGTILSVEDEAQLVEDMQYPIRKCAHMIEYMVLALLICVGLYAWNARDKRLILFEFLIAFAYACTDEFHQLFVSGRAGQLRDVMIDSVGIFVAVAITYIVVLKNRR